MAGASSRAHARYHTEPLDPQAPAGDEGGVARLRIVNIGATAAARSGGTLQMNVTIQPAQSHQERGRPQVIYARPVAVRSEDEYRPRPDAYRPNWTIPRATWTSHDAAANVAETVPGETMRYAEPRQQMAAMQERVLRAFSGLQSGRPTQRLMVRRWTTPSNVVWTAAVGIYALALFLFALFSS